MLDSPAFEKLLAALAPDRDRAALEYAQLRKRLSGLLRWWGASSSDELADEALDRVARKLQEGARIADGSLGAYVRGVARMIFLESSRRAQPGRLPTFAGRLPRSSGCRPPPSEFERIASVSSWNARWPAGPYSRGCSVRETFSLPCAFLLGDGM